MYSFHVEDLIMLMPCVGHVVIYRIKNTCTSKRTCAADLGGKDTQVKISKGCKRGEGGEGSPLAVLSCTYGFSYIIESMEGRCLNEIRMIRQTLH